MRSSLDASNHHSLFPATQMLLLATARFPASSLRAYLHQHFTGYRRSELAEEQTLGVGLTLTHGLHALDLGPALVGIEPAEQAFSMRERLALEQIHVEAARLSPGCPERSNATAWNLTLSLVSAQASGLSPTTSAAGQSGMRAEDVSVSPLGSLYSSSARISCGVSCLGIPAEQRPAAPSVVERERRRLSADVFRPHPRPRSAPRIPHHPTSDTRRDTSCTRRSVLNALLHCAVAQG